MYFDLSFRKMRTLGLILGGLLFATAFFSLANGSFALLARAEERLSMTRSSTWYWLFYQLPNGNLAAAAEAKGNARSVPVLLYHGEGSASDMPLSAFVEQMRALKADGWHTITMAEFDAWQKGEAQLPAKSFLLTFDDGRKDTYYQADPVLKDLGFHAVMFVITGFSLPKSGPQTTFYLNKTELADMIASGRWELESHGDMDHGSYAVETTVDLAEAASTTVGHFLSNKFWSTAADRFETDGEFRARIEGDLATSKQKLEQTFGTSVIAFAYPFNDYGPGSVNYPASQSVLDSVVPSLYSYAFYQTWPSNGDTYNYPQTSNGPGSSAYMEKRIEPDASWSGTDLIAILDAGAAKPLPYRQSAFGSEWVGVWGSTTVGDVLALAATAKTSGADAFLNGSGWWTNYIFSATIDWEHAAGVSLIARNSDDMHYVSCTFTNSSVRIEQREGTRSTTLAEAKMAAPSVEVELGIGVSDNTITCYRSGMALVSSAGAMPRHGGIGVEIWDPVLGAARIRVHSVSASASE